MKFKYTALCLLLGFTCILIGCKDFKNPDQIPAYVYLQPFSLETTASQGANTHQVTDTWMYANGSFLGVYEPGRAYPVLEEGLTNLRIFGGIRENAITELISIYPMYDSVVINTELRAGRADTIRPVLRYNAKCTFPLIEDFESNHIFSDDIDEDPVSKMNRSSEMVRSGSFAGKLEVTEVNPVNEVGTALIYENLPKNGAAIFLEMDYQTDVPLFVGLQMFNPGQPVEKYYKLQLLPRSGWNKVYIRLNDEIRGFNKQGYKIILSTSFDPDKGSQVQRAFIDNVKLIHL